MVPIRVVTEMSGALLPQARGIPRYTLSLAQSMAKRRGIHDYRAALVGEVTPRNAFVYAELESSFAENGVYRCFKVPAAADFPADINLAISDALAMSGVRRYSPDAIHFTNLFGVDAPSLVAPSVDASACSEVICATLYDLIPLVMPEMFLSDPSEDRRYRSCLDRVSSCDLILSISESSRRDAIGLLGVEEDRIVTIGADSSAVFRPFISDPASLSEANRLKRRLGIECDFVLYCGGSSQRKNIEGLVSAFSALPPRSVVTANWSFPVFWSNPTSNDCSVSPSLAVCAITSWCSPAMCRTRTWPASTLNVSCSFSHLCMKVSDCRYSKRCDVAPR